MPRIFLTSPKTVRELYYGDEALAGLRKLGEVSLNRSEEALSLDELISAARGKDILVSDRQTAAPAALFDAVPELGAFIRCAVDIRNVDVEAATRNRTLVTHASPGFLDSVTELVIGMMIDLARHISASVLEYRDGRSPPVQMGVQLAGSAIGIIGFGAIGRRLSERCAGLGMQVLVNDPFVTDFPDHVEVLELHQLLANCQFNVCLAIANDRTEKLVDDAAFSVMRPQSFFINVSRGNLVDDDALLTALDNGQIAGCAIDVGRAPDQMPPPRLARHPKVIATPHIGGLTPQAIRHQALETVAQCQAFLRGHAITGAANGKWLENSRRD